MLIQDSLERIRPAWINRVVQKLARGNTVRADFRQQLERFYDLLVQVVDTGEYGWLDPLLADWAASMSQATGEGELTNLTHLLREVVAMAHELCLETLEPGEALEVISHFTPCFLYAFEKAAAFEVQNKVIQITSELKSVQGTLERLERSKSDFIAVAAHELKTPLTLVEGYTAMLSDLLPKADEERAQTMLDGIHNGTRRLRAIVDDMIDVSMIDNNLLSLNFQPVWVNRLLSVLKGELETAVTERNQQLIIEDFPGARDLTFGDPERLLQIFRNVLTNAIKYTPDGGAIRVEGRRLPGFLEVTITDTGIGVAPEDQEAIFEKFGRLGNISLHSSGKTKYKGGGPGLGLHIARGMLEAHGGAIWVESLGCDEKSFPGSTFHILLPLRDAPPDDHSARLFAPLSQTTPREGQ